MDFKMPPNLIRPFLHANDRAGPRLVSMAHAINRMNDGVYPPNLIAQQFQDFGEVSFIVADLVAVDNQDLMLVGQKIDGLAIDDTMTILLVGQDDPTENGLWYPAAASAANPSGNWVLGQTPSLVLITDGSVYFSSLWGLVDPDPDVLDYEIANDIVRRFKITSINPNIITCNPINTAGTVDTSFTVDIARPYLAQSIASWNGLTFVYTDSQTRTATSGLLTETQVMIPKYVVGDFIIAARSFDTGIADVDWADVNADARMWSKKAGT